MRPVSSPIEAPCTTQAVDMWTMRLNGAGLARGQREYTLPTAQTLAHMPTASHRNLIKEVDQCVDQCPARLHWPVSLTFDSLRPLAKDFAQDQT